MHLTFPALNMQCENFNSKIMKVLVKELRRMRTYLHGTSSKRHSRAGYLQVWTFLEIENGDIPACLFAVVAHVQPSRKLELEREGGARE